MADLQRPLLGIERQCRRFVDDPQAPGLCVGCGNDREAHALSSKQQVLANLREMIETPMFLGPLAKRQIAEAITLLAADETREQVSLELKMRARPQLIAPKGRWYFELEGRMFRVIAPHYLAAHSREDAERDGRTLATHLGLIVSAVNVEKIDAG